MYIIIKKTNLLTFKSNKKLMKEILKLMQITGILLFACLVCSFTTEQQQSREITGTVVDATGEAVIGASVMVKGTSNGTITDIDGNFKVNAGSKSALVISYIGYITQEIPVGNQNHIKVVLKDDTQTLDEVVVVGFGKQKKVNLTGSVAVVDSKALEARPVTNVTQALQGLVPGMNFSYSQDGNGGEMGQDMKINIRGAGTIGKGSNASPLVLIDGMEGDMNVLNPNDIESISVLKDAAASSIYGSRAPFGVVLITTKRGKAGKVSINYNNNFRWSQAINMPSTPDSYTYARYMNLAALNTNEALLFPEENLKNMLAYQNGEIPSSQTTHVNNDGKTWNWLGNSNNDWYDILFGGTAFSQEHSLSINGGTEKFQYYLSGNFMDQTGLISYNPDKLKRYTVTAKINAELFPWLHVNYSTKYMRKDYSKPSALDENVFYHNIAKRFPSEPLLTPNGDVMNGLVGGLLYQGEDNNQTDWLYQQFQVVLEPIKDWKIFGELNYKTVDGFHHIDHLHLPQYYVDGTMYYNDTNSVEEHAERTNFFNPNIYSEFMKSLANGHTFKVMVGFQAELNKWRKLGASRTDLITEEIPDLNAATGPDKILINKDSGDKSHWATAGFFGRINYDYKERYLLEFNMRYDGTSRFAANQRWNWFPSVSAGWNIAREEFMKPLENIINTLKFRGSWGELGNQNTTSLYPYIQTMPFIPNDKDNHWLINNSSFANTSTAPDLISALLGWETMRSWNIGFDLGMFNNRLNMSFDWFNRKTINMVGPAPTLPATLGTAVPQTNNADLQSTGFELDLSWRDRIGDVQYGVHVLLSDDRQKVLKYPNEKGLISTWRNGQYLGEIWGFETVGLAKTDQEMQDHLASLPNGGQDEIGKNWAAGDIMYKDLDEDGTIHKGTTIDNPGDLKIIGNSTPRYKFGLDLDAAWKGFDIRVFFQGVLKRDFWFDGNMFYGATGNRWQSGFFNSQMDFFRSGDDFWNANTDAYLPRPLFNNQNQQKQTRYLQNAAYCRLKNLQIGYTIPARYTQKIGISNLRIFFSAENLLTITSLPDSFDPETIGTGYGANWGDGNSSAKTHPLSQTFSTGLSVNF